MRTPTLAVLVFGAALCSGCSDDGKSNPVPVDAAVDAPHEGSTTDGSPTDGSPMDGTATDASDASDSGASDAGDAGAG
jgi:hypothetical protein